MEFGPHLGCSRCTIYYALVKVVSCHLNANINETSFLCQFVATMRHTQLASVCTRQFISLNCVMDYVCDVLCALFRGKTIVRRSH